MAMFMRGLVVLGLMLGGSLGGAEGIVEKLTARIQTMEQVQARLCDEAGLCQETPLGEAIRKMTMAQERLMVMTAAKAANGQGPGEPYQCGPCEDDVCEPCEPYGPQGPNGAENGNGAPAGPGAETPVMNGGDMVGAVDGHGGSVNGNNGGDNTGGNTGGNGGSSSGGNGGGNGGGH